VHSEFVKLGEHLISACPEAIVPAVPPATTSAGAGTDEDEVRLKASMQRWLNIVCSNDILIRDEEMVFFVESDFGYSPVVRRKQPATGVRRKVIKQFAPPPDDTPELAAARPVVKAFYLGTMEAEQKLEKVVKHRRSEFILTRSGYIANVVQILVSPNLILGPNSPHCMCRRRMWASHTRTRSWVKLFRRLVTSMLPRVLPKPLLWVTHSNTTAVMLLSQRKL
jgi:hypothetical protein